MYVHAEVTMPFSSICLTYAVAAQISYPDLAEAKALGYTMIICNRLDWECDGELSIAKMSAAAERHGLKFAHVPVGAEISDADVADMERALARNDGRTLAYCRLGNRSTRVGALALAANLDPVALLTAASNAGFDLSDLTERLEGRHAAARLTA